MLLQYIHNFHPHDAIYLVKCTSPSCSKAPPQHDASSRLGWFSSACKPPPFPPNITMVIMAKLFCFCFIRPEDISPASSPGPLLLFWDWFALFAPKYVHLLETERVSFLSGMTAARSHGVYTCVLLFVQMNVILSGIWKILPRKNQTCGGIQFFFWGLGWFLLIFPWCKAKRHWVWR